METQDTEQNQIDFMSKKLFNMNEKLDQLVLLAHQLVVQNKVLSDENGHDDTKFVTDGSVPKRSMLTSTPVRTQLHKSPKWSTLTHAQQLEILHEVASEHTKVTLDFEGLRQAIVASQRVEALKKTFGIGDGDQSSPEEEAYIKDLFEENIELSMELVQHMEDYLQAEIQSMSLKTEAAKKFAESRNLYTEHYGDVNSDDDVTGNETDSPDAKLNSNVEKKKRLLQSEENKTQQMKTLIQKLMLSYPNLGLRFDDATNQRFRDMFIKCGEPIHKLRDNI